MKDLLYCMMMTASAVYGMMPHDSRELSLSTEAQKTNLYDFVFKLHEDTNNTWKPKGDPLFDFHVFKLRKSANTYVELLQSDNHEIIEKIAEDRGEAIRDFHKAHNWLMQEKNKCISDLRCLAGAQIPFVTLDSFMAAFFYLSDSEKWVMG